MNFIIRLLVTALVVLGLTYIIPGVTVDGFGTALIVVIVLGILNAIVKPLLILFTLPITIFTLGLFLLVINVLVIYMADGLIAGFKVDNFLSALIFSLGVSLAGYIASSITKDKD